MSKCAIVTVTQSHTSQFFVEVPDDWDADRIEVEFDHRDIEDRARPYSHRERKSMSVSLSGDEAGCPSAVPFVIAS